jgi:hypothetical protein
MAQLNPSPGATITREEARASLDPELRKTFDELVSEIGKWSDYFYGRKLISYAMIAELVRDGWHKGIG